MLASDALPVVCNALVAAPDGKGKDAAETGTAAALSCASVNGPVTESGAVNLVSILERLALPVDCNAEVEAPDGSGSVATEIGTALALS